jgi:hypothetical protein
MRKLLLLKIRLTWYFGIFLGVAFLLVFLLPKQQFTSGALTLFSVNSFLYGFYLAPILSAQKARIEEMHRVGRSESNAIFEMVLGLKKLPPELRNELQAMFTLYLRTCTRQRKAAQGEEQYEALITYCVHYEGKYDKEIQKLLEKLVANQQNRTQFGMLMANKIFSHEWFIILVLYGITTGFILTIYTGEPVIYRCVAAFLAAGLTMLLLILVKLSTLTHKKAHEAWRPYTRLMQTHYYRID